MPNDHISAVQAGNPINGTSVDTPRRVNKFNDSYSFGQTDRFGEITPHFVMNSVAKDKISLRSSHRIRTYSLKSPLLQDIQVKKDYFTVPMPTILPLQWDRIFANPNLGDDVPADAYTHVEGLHSAISDYVDAVVGGWFEGDTVKGVLNDFFRMFYLLESFYSKGSLINSLGCNLTKRCRFTDTVTSEQRDVDEEIEYFISTVFGSLDDHKIPGFYVNETNADGEVINIYTVFCDGRSDMTALLGTGITLRRYLEIIRDNSPYYFEITDVLDDADEDESLTLWTYQSYFDALTVGSHYLTIFKLNDKGFDLAPLWAYQICCAHFYTNDSVDYIYSAELFRQLVHAWNTTNLISTEEVTPTFEYNGMILQYDYLSAHFFNGMCDMLSDGDDEPLIYISYLCSFRHSLRFVDYFTGSRTRPLAVGDTSVDVNDGAVDVVDVTRNIQVQRFLNAVNRTGRKISNYMKGIFGVDIPSDYHEPMYLGHTSDSLFAQEVENTGDAQQANANSITSLIRGNSERFAFEFTCQIPSIILGLTYFDIKRHYSESTDRTMFHKDRYDFFNPFMEFVGDQPIYTNEIKSYPSADDGEIFGYQSRYMEYKQRVNRVVGGFVKNLPGFIFIADNVKGLPNPSHLSPSYIRSSNVELDEFYISLTGYSLANYFHFIVLNENSCDAVRPMSYNPQIL